jgi:hypothetical protein
MWHQEDPRLLYVRGVNVEAFIESSQADDLLIGDGNGLLLTSPANPLVGNVQTPISAAFVDRLVDGHRSKCPNSHPNAMSDRNTHAGRSTHILAFCLLDEQPGGFTNRPQRGQCLSKIFKHQATKSQSYGEIPSVPIFAQIPVLLTTSPHDNSRSFEKIYTTCISKEMRSIVGELQLQFFGAH